MTGKREKKREDLKNRLIAAAIASIGADGIHALTARAITTKAGCALGSLYTVFDDLDDLVIHANSATLHRLGEAVEMARAGISDPVDMLKALARGYVAFARENYSLWIALFDYGALSGVSVPEWHRREQSVLIDLIVGPVSRLSPDLDTGELSIRARTLFSAVHGIVSNSLADRFVGVPETMLDDELMKFVDQMVAGLASQKKS